MGMLTAFSHRSLIRAAAVTDTALPGRLQVPANDPIERLAIFLTHRRKIRRRPARPGAGVSAAGNEIPRHPAETPPGDPRPLDDKERAELVRWIDTLDRFVAPVKNCDQPRAVLRDIRPVGYHETRHAWHRSRNKVSGPALAAGFLSERIGASRRFLIDQNWR